MRDKHSIIFDPVRIEKVESIYLDAGGEKATVDSYRWTGHEYGNVSEFDSDDRLSPRKIEVKFKPLPPTSDFALLAGGATFLTNLRVQKGLGQLIDNLSEKLETHFGSLKLYGGLHNTAHFLLRNDPASETHAHLVEKIFFDADVIDTMVNEFYSPFLFFKGVKPPKLKGKANDLYGDSYHTASINAVAYMLGCQAPDS